MNTEKRNLSVAVIGDINLDISSSLTDVKFSDIKSDTYKWASIGSQVGGTAGNFAIAATDRFADVHVYGKIGSDMAGATIDDTLEKVKSLHAHLAVDKERATRIVLSLRDTSGKQGKRLLVTDPNAAPSNLKPEDIKHYFDNVASYDVVLFDGYSLLSGNSKQTIMEAARAAQEANVPVAFDIVPHKISDFLTYTELEPILSIAGFIITEYTTLKELLAINDEDMADRNTVIALAEKASEIIGEGKTFSIRYGVGNINDVMLIQPGVEPEYKSTGYVSTVDKSRFGDKVTIQELRKWLENRQQ